MSLSNDINTTSTALSDIKDAIIAQGVTPSGDISTYATAIGQISGGSANIQSLSVTPTTSAQTITASGDVDGYSPVNVSAVTSSIDANIIAGNIKDGVTILGVTGDYTGSGGSSTYFGMNINNFIGEVSIDNGLMAPNNIPNLIFTGVELIDDKGLQNRFRSRTGVDNWSVSFPDLDNVGTNSMDNTFYNSNITSFSCPLLTLIGTNGFKGVCKDCNSLTSINLESLEEVGQNGLSEAFANCRSLTGLIDLSSLTTVSYGAFGSAFDGTAITGVDLSSLTTMSDGAFRSAFNGCTQLSTIDISSIVDIPNTGMQLAFANCSLITSVDLSSIETIGTRGMEECFSGCNIQSVSFDALNQIGEYGLQKAFAFNLGTSQENPAMQSLSFPSLRSDSFNNKTNCFQEMLYITLGTTVHFPSNLQSVIGNWSDVLGGFGGNNITVLFDLTATE